MNRVLPLLLVVPLSTGCRNAPGPGAATSTAGQPARPGATAQAGAAAPAGLPGQAPAVKPVPGTLPDVIAKVNGEPVERWELDNAVKRAESRAGGPVPADQRDRILRNIVDQLVAFHMLAQESQARNLDATDAEVEGELAKVRQSFPTEDAYQQSITAQGLTPDLLRRQTRMILQVQKIVEIEVNAKVVVADKDVEAFYGQNVDRFKRGDSVHASHILIAAPQDASAEQKQQARTRAQQVLAQVRAGSDFAQVAREQSQDAGSAPQGGDLGFFPKGQMTPTFEEAAFALKPGATSGVVESPFGFHIIKVHERQAARTMPLAEVRLQVKEFLMQGQRESKLEQFIQQWKAKTKIEILV